MSWTALTTLTTDHSPLTSVLRHLSSSLFLQSSILNPMTNIINRKSAFANRKSPNLWPPTSVLRHLSSDISRLSSVTCYISVSCVMLWGYFCPTRFRIGAQNGSYRPKTLFLWIDAERGSAFPGGQGKWIVQVMEYKLGSKSTTWDLILHEFRLNKVLD